MPAYSRPLLNMMEHAYRIRNWKDHFETYESSKIKGPLSWVAIPTKHDGRGYKRMTRHPHGVQALCGWWSMLGVAAKMPIHGLLADRDGPLDADDIAEKTNLPAKIYLTAFKAASDDKIGWLETVPWNRNLDFAGNIAALMASQHLPADALDFQRATARPSGKQRKAETQSAPAKPLSPQRQPAQPSASAGETAEHSGAAEKPADISVQDRTRQDKTIPLPSPKGDSQPPNLITNPAIAKRLICEKILGGKNPDRPWSYEAEEGLARLTKPPGMPLQEILDIATYRQIPKSDDIPELKFRIDPVTETGLMKFWGDEARRAGAYLEKYRVGKNGASGEKKPEPKRWPDFFRWKYGADCQLPPSFHELDFDQKKEWEREHADFEAMSVREPAEVASE